MRVFLFDSNLFEWNGTTMTQPIRFILVFILLSRLKVSEDEHRDIHLASRGRVMRAPIPIG